jgi:hypothetical protein
MSTGKHDWTPHSALESASWIMVKWRICHLLWAILHLAVCCGDEQLLHTAHNMLLSFVLVFVFVLFFICPLLLLVFCLSSVVVLKMLTCVSYFISNFVFPLSPFRNGFVCSNTPNRTVNRKSVQRCYCYFCFCSSRLPLPGTGTGTTCATKLYPYQ